MARYETRLSTAEDDYVWTWDADDAMHAVEQLTDDPALYSHLGPILSLTVGEIGKEIQ